MPPTAGNLQVLFIGMKLVNILLSLRLLYLQYKDKGGGYGRSNSEI